MLKSPLLDFLEQLHQQFAQEKNGKVADYIPELAKADPQSFGIAMVTREGATYHVGAAQELFTIQSISKPFVFGLALEDHGVEKVMSKVGVEPSGEAFNSIRLDPTTGCPANAMINAGAITATSLIKGGSSEIKTARIIDFMSKCIGHPLKINERVYQCERDTGHRNRAIAHLLRNSNIIEEDPEPSLDAYFRQCSIEVTCIDLAVMAGTLANNGINPVTGIQAISPKNVVHMLSVMSTCGMYDYAGEWIFRVGIPAKSGVGGGIIAVLPGQVGLGTFSPPLDRLGNSVRGIKVCEEFSRQHKLHLFLAANPSSGVVRRITDATSLFSNRQRNKEEAEALRQHGKEIEVVEIQGEIIFVSMEKVVREVLEKAVEAKTVILNFRHVSSVAESCYELVARLEARLKENDKNLALTELQRVPVFEEYLKKSGLDLKIWTHLDLALEWAEDRLLERHGGHSQQEQVALASFEILNRLTVKEIARLEAVLISRKYSPGEALITAGEDSLEFFFLLKGKISVLLENVGMRPFRIATCTPGMTFGEVALLDRTHRSATVRADTAVECLVLNVTDFDALLEKEPRLIGRLMQNLCTDISHRLRKSNIMLGTYTR